MPRVLIIGDSVSRGYTLPVRAALSGLPPVPQSEDFADPADAPADPEADPDGA